MFNDTIISAIKELKLNSLVYDRNIQLLESICKDLVWFPETYFKTFINSFKKDMTFVDFFLNYKVNDSNELCKLATSNLVKLETLSINIFNKYLEQTLEDISLSQILYTSIINESIANVKTFEFFKSKNLFAYGEAKAAICKFQNIDN